MADRETALSYLAEGHTLLRAHGLYGASGEPHAFALDRALNNFSAAGGYKDAAKAAAALQALYEAKRLVTPRASLEGRRILLGDFFMSLAVQFSLPLRNAALSALVVREMEAIGADASRVFGRSSKRAFLQFADEFCAVAVGLQPVPQMHVGLPGKIANNGIKLRLRGNYYQIKHHNAVKCRKSRLIKAVLCEKLPLNRKKVPKNSSTSGTAAFLAIRDTNPIAADTTAETLRFLNRKQFIHPPAQLDGNPLLLALEGGYYAETSVRARRLLARMEAVFAQLFDKPDANEMDGYIFRALTCGGKRLRPLLVCIASEIRAGRAADEDLVVRLMAVVELMHCASLVHDDIVDRSPLRRSRATINAEKGDGYAALCGFRMIGAALELLREAEDPEIAELIARIPLEMSRGELRQLKVEFDLDAQTEADYIERVTRKTAVLIEGSLQLGAIAGGAAPGPRAALSDYGLALGVLFQLRDDLLDFAPSPSDGKPVSQDMERGIYSLPLLFALGALPENEPEGAKLRALLRKTIKSPSELRGLVLTAQRSGGVDYTIERLRAYAGTAEDAVLRLHQTACTEALLLITETLSTECAAAKKPLLAVVKRTNP